MPDPGTLRDSTEIVLPPAAVDEIRDDLEREFTVTVYCEDADCRIIGSPVVIKEVGNWLARQGIAID
jgi:hypothetical protein